MKKKIVGVFSFTGCAGCQMQLLNLEGLLPIVAKEVDIVHFPMAREKNRKGPFDVVFVEGAISTPKQVEEVKYVRNRTKKLVAFGTCACFGGVPNIKNFLHKATVCAVYPPGAHVDSICATGIDSYVEVDYYLRGCPVDRNETLSALHAIVAGRIPLVESRPVCTECRTRQNRCLFPDAPCMGPISLAGCNAVCPSNGFVCEGCRGPTDDANLKQMIELFKFHGLTHDEIVKKLRTFAGSSKKYGEFLCDGELENL
ncbi:MAG: oxidoreductase [Candidatus Micrarchaeia archaeon]